MAPQPTTEAAEVIQATYRCLSKKIRNDVIGLTPQDGIALATDRHADCALTAARHAAATAIEYFILIP